MKSKLKTIYKTGAWVSGIAACGTTVYNVHPHLQEAVMEIIQPPSKPSEQLTYDEFVKTHSSGYQYTTCASRIVDHIFSYPAFLLDRTFSYDSPRKIFGGCIYFGLQGAVGFTAGLGVGLTWPVSVSLIALEIAETKYGYKLC